MMKTLCSSLVRVLTKSGYLLHISNALDCFYEIWSEDYYDQMLIENNVIGLLKQGNEYMTTMFKQVNKKKEFAPNEIDEIDEAL
jgi:hypothetical protein